MASSEQAATDTRYGRRLRWLFAGIVVALALYTAGWFVFAAWIEGQVRQALDDASKDGVTVGCDGLSSGGFPFRIGIVCDAVRFDDSRQGISASAGALRTAAQIYDPAHLIAELDGPAKVVAPGAPQLTATWDLLRASGRLAEPLPARASVEANALRLAAGEGGAIAGADHVEAHMRTRDADVDFAATFAGLALDPRLTGGRTLPPLAGEADATIAGGVAFFASEPQSMRGLSGEVRALVLRLGGDSAVTIRGPAAVDADGLIDATLSITVKNPGALGQALGDIVPESRDQIRSVLSGFASLANAEGETPPLPVRIAKGEVSVAFFRIGAIPPLN